MKKKYLVIIISLALSSCALLSDIYTIDNKNDKRKYPANVQIYINNKSNEIINIQTIGEVIPILLARLSPGDMELFNIKRGTKIFINSENSKRISVEIICNEDQKTYNIY